MPRTCCPPTLLLSAMLALVPARISVGQEPRPVPPAAPADVASIDAIITGGIVTIFWFSERPEVPIPEKYLPRR